MRCYTAAPYSHHAEGDKNIIQQKPKATRWKNTLAVIKKRISRDISATLFLFQETQWPSAILAA
jgi:hypothetical protein